MQKLVKRISLVMVALMTVFTALSYMPAKAATVVPQVQFVGTQKTEFTAGERITFNLNASNYGGRVQYRVVLWNDQTKSYSDLWNTADKYYTNWMPYGNETLPLGWVINEPGTYRITVYAKRAGLANSKTALKGMNCDSYLNGPAFVVKPAAAPTVESIAPVADVTVNEGETVVLPTEVTLNLADKTTKTAKVTWAAVDTTKVGTVAVEGTVEGTDKKATVNVVVKAVALEVKEIKALNLAEIQVTFNTAVDKASIDLENVLYDGTKLDSNNKDAFTLADDKKSVVFFKNGGFVTSQQQTRKISLSGIKSVSGSVMTEVKDQKVTFTDTDVPTLTKVDVVGSKLLKLVFSEPVKNLSESKIYANYRIDGKAVIGDSSTAISVSRNTITLSLAAGLAAGEHTMNFVNNAVKDYAGFAAVAQNVTFSVGADTNKPAIASIEKAEQNMLELQFDKAVNVSAAKIYWMNGVVKKYASVYTLADKTYVYADFYDAGHTKALPLVPTTVYIEGVKDYFGNSMDKTEISVTAVADITRPTVESVVPEKYNETGAFIVTFSEDVNVPSAWYNKITVTDKNGYKVTVTGVAYNVDSTGDQVKNELRFTGSFGSANAPYTVTVKDITDLSPQENASLTQQFTVSVSDTTKPAITTVVYSNNSIILTYSKQVDPATAADLGNYTYEYNSNYINFPSGADISISNNLKVVTITLPATWNVGTAVVTPAYFNTGSVRIIVNNVSDLLGNTMGVTTSLVGASVSAGTVATVDSIQTRNANTIRINLASGNLPVDVYAGDFEIVKTDGTATGIAVIDAKLDAANRRITLTLSDDVNANGTTYGTPGVTFRVKTVASVQITKDAYGNALLVAAATPADFVGSSIDVPATGLLAVSGNTVVVPFDEALSTIAIGDVAGTAFVVRDRDGNKLAFGTDYVVRTGAVRTNEVEILFTGSQPSYVTVELTDNTLVKDVAGNLANDFEAVQSAGPVAGAFTVTGNGDATFTIANNFGQAITADPGLDLLAADGSVDVAQGSAEYNFAIDLDDATTTEAGDQITVSVAATTGVVTVTVTDAAGVANSVDGTHTITVTNVATGATATIDIVVAGTTVTIN